jgi:hypothetical protein
VTSGRGTSPKGLGGPRRRPGQGLRALPLRDPLARGRFAPSRRCCSSPPTTDLAAACANG